MKTYVNCFLAIPLSARYAKPHQELLARLGSEFPDLNVDDPGTPHVTLYYLGDQPESALPKILEVAARVAQQLHAELTVDGYGTFENAKRIIYLAVEPNPELTDANAALKRELSDFRGAENRDGYTPHVTVARAEPDSLNAEQLTEIEQQLNPVSWTFPVTEIALYGTPPGETARRIIERIPCPPSD